MTRKELVSILKKYQKPVQAHLNLIDCDFSDYKEDFNWIIDSINAGWCFKFVNYFYYYDKIIKAYEPFYALTIKDFQTAYDDYKKK